MATANASLEERLKTEPQSAIDIENTDGFSGPVIEMVWSGLFSLLLTYRLPDRDTTDLLIQNIPVGKHYCFL